MCKPYNDICVSKLRMYFIIIYDYPGAPACNLACNAPGVCVLNGGSPACRCPDGYELSSTDQTQCESKQLLHV